MAANAPTPESKGTNTAHNKDKSVSPHASGVPASPEQPRAHPSLIKDEQGSENGGAERRDTNEVNKRKAKEMLLDMDTLSRLETFLGIPMVPATRHYRFFRPGASRPDDVLIPMRYEVLKHLGSGGYGAVVEMRDFKTGELYACKIVKLNYFSDDVDTSVARELTVLERYRGIMEELIPGSEENTQGLMQAKHVLATKNNDGEVFALIFQTRMTEDLTS